MACAAVLSAEVVNDAFPVGFRAAVPKTVLPS